MDGESLVYIRHIFDEVKYLKGLTEKISFEEFMENETYRRAAERSIEIIGEASNNISEETAKEFSDIDWSGMYKMRNRLIHGYFKVEPVLVWDTMVTDIPDLFEKISVIFH